MLKRVNLQKSLAAKGYVFNLGFGGTTWLKIMTHSTKAVRFGSNNT